MMRAQEPEALTPLHEVITFYSYKGGTGRTMALANVACLFARQIGSGRVLAIDWDLEAPGLHYYLRSPSGEAADPNVEGVVEYFTRIQEILGSVSADPDGEEKAAESVLEQLPLDRYRRPTCVSNIDLMPAGRLDETYSSRLAKLDWQLIYEKSPALFRTFARRLAREYDVVLVDSRTGMTDISGICTALLPDKLVVVFTANQQSLTGVERLVLNSVEYRQGSRDLRPLLVYPLPSRIDAERDKLRQLWRFGDAERRIEGFQPQFERIFCSAYAMASSDLTNYCNEVQVQHSPDYSYGEEVAALDAADADRFSIVRSYEALVQWLSSSAAPWESPQKARQRQRLESSLLDEERMLESGTPPDVRSLMSLQEEVVRLALEQRPQHLDTVAAIERLVQTCLKRANDVGRAIEVLDTLTVALSSMRLPAKLKAVDVLLNGARLLKARGQTDEARRLSGVALEEVTASQAVLDEAGLDAVERIAVGLRRGGSFGEARTLLEVVRDRRIQLKNADDPSVLTSMNNLADTLRGQGDLAGARALHEQVLAVRRRMLGEEAPETLTSMNNLAETLRVQGDLTGALALQEQVLAVRRRVLGEEHPATLTSMNNLAGTLRAQGDWTGARMLEEQVLAVRRRVLGEEHPHTLASMNNLAETLRAQGELAGARTLQEQVLAIIRRVLGEEHPHTLSAMNNLAGTLGAQGNLAGARTLQEQTLAVRRRLLGEDHLDTLASMNNLAGTLRAQGDLAGARALQEQTLAVSRRVLGEEHPDTLTSMNNLAEMLRAQGDLTGARALQEQVMAVRRRVLGEEHLRTLGTMNNLANTLQEQGDLARARALQERVLTVRRRVLGEEHPDTLTSMNNLAGTLGAQGDLAGARTLQEQTLAVRRRLLGEEHPDTLALMNNLAGTLRAQGDLAGARALQEQTLVVSRRVLGEEHPDTLGAMNSLAETLLSMGMLGEAQQLQKEALALQRNLLSRATDPLAGATFKHSAFQSLSKGISERG